MSLLSNFESFLKKNFYQLNSINEKLFNFLIYALLTLNFYDFSFHFFIDRSFNLHQIFEFILFTGIIFVMVFMRLILKKYNKLVLLEIYRNHQKISFYKEKYKNMISDMNKEIDKQFDRWKFTPEEKKIAKYLILGYSFKGIAAFFDKSEKTVRNQSLEIYNKSGMISRNDLAGYFLSDFFQLDED